MIKFKNGMKFLFIGNSATYVNEIPQSLKKLAEAAGFYFETAQITPGGYTLRQHADTSTEHGKKAEKIDFDTARFFIKPEGSDRAVSTAESGAPTVINTVLGCILILMIFITLSLFVPDILDFFTGR